MLSIWVIVNTGLSGQSIAVLLRTEYKQVHRFILGYCPLLQIVT